MCYWIDYISYLDLAFKETITACIRLIIVGMILKIVSLESQLLGLSNESIYKALAYIMS